MAFNYIDMYCGVYITFSTTSQSLSLIHIQMCIRDRGFIMQKLYGNGIAFMEIDGELVEYELAPGQQLVVDTGYVAAFETSVSMDIQQVAGLKNKFLGGEGFFNTVLTGPGKVFLQTMPVSNVAEAIKPFIPTKTN